MSKETKLAQVFLEGFSQKQTTDLFETIVQLSEELETKNDPTPEEIKIVESIYHFIEKIKVMEYSIRNYIKENNKNLPGNKLNSLYNRKSYGTSVMFD